MIAFWGLLKKEMTVTWGGWAAWIVLFAFHLISSVLFWLRLLQYEKIVQKCNTSEMIWSIPKTIEFISKYVTLGVGDCIFTGTSGTAGQIKPGDEVIVDIENVGKLSNRCI